MREIVDQHKQEGYPHPDEEQLELKRMGEEAEEWIKLGGLLLNNLGTIQDKREETQPKAAMVEEKDDEAKGEKSTEGSEQGKATEEEELPEKLPDEMSVIGVDDNIHAKSLQQAIEEVLEV